MQQDRWNLKLREGVVDCFVEGLLGMLRHPVFYTRGIEYIPIESLSSTDFFTCLDSKICNIVGSKPIVHTISTKHPWASPSNVIIVPYQYQYQGAPIFTEEELQFELPDHVYADLAYTNRGCDILKHIGCQEMDVELIFTILSTPNFPFYRKPDGWFYNLFKLLLSFLYSGHDFEDIKQKCRAPRYLQIKDGTGKCSWTSFNQHMSIFFPLKEDIAENVKDLGFIFITREFDDKFAKMG